MFLKLDGLSGASTSPRHFGEIEISGWSWGGSQRQQTIALGAEPDAAATNLVNDLTVPKQIDKVSPSLMEACATGRKFPEAVMRFETVSESGNLMKSLPLKMKAVVITSVSSSIGAETVSFTFEKIEMAYARTAG
jgi:type VI secretion system secreted protein Hcp